MSKPPFRADQVGSLLRPAALSDTRARWRAGEVDAATLRSVANQARNASASAPPSSAGWRKPWKRTKARTQWT